MDINYERETFAWGDGVRLRLTRVWASGLSVKKPTDRLIAGAAPVPLSQYDIGSDQKGFRLPHTERGHLIGLQFGGPESKYNLVPMYAGFNGGSGAWGRFESAMASYLHGSNDTLSLSVYISYPRNDDPIPSMFCAGVTSDRGYGLPQNLLGFHVFMHEPPPLYFKDLQEDDLALYDTLIKYTRKMALEGWLIEDYPSVVVSGSGRVSRSAPTGRAIQLSVSELDIPTLKSVGGHQGWPIIYASRPYAVLDYLKVKDPGIYSTLGFPSFSAYDNTSGFSTPQRQAIQKVNVLFNIGYMGSDLAFSDQEPYKDLAPGSADSKPQVDHISGKAESGSNAYSNDRLVSKTMNLKLRTDPVRKSIIDFYMEERNWPAIVLKLKNTYG
jgi:DNA/RNA non-specific endonuclease